MPPGRQVDPLGLVRPEILALPGYEPVEPVELIAERLGLPAARVAKLDANENPYGPSPRALEVLARYQGYETYPDPDQRRLRAALSRHLAVPPESIVAATGSDELIQLLCSAFLRPGDNAIDIVPSFGMYSFETGIAGGRTVDVQRRPDFSVDVAAVAERVDERTRLIFATSPNNPTGNLLSRDELLGLLDLGLPVALDEAYIEFAGVASGVGLVTEHPNLVVLRTFSKWAGLAGLRIGYGVMDPALAECLFRIKQPYNVNVAAEAAAIASLEDAETLMQRVALLVTERERLAAQLAELSFLRPYPSSANFVLCEVLGDDARLLRDRLREEGVFVRYFGRERLASCIRISAGLPQHTEQVIDALKRLAPALGAMG